MVIIMPPVRLTYIGLPQHLVYNPKKSDEDIIEIKPVNRLRLYNNR